MKIQSYFSENKTFQRVSLRQNTTHPTLRHSRDMFASLSWLAIDLIHWSEVNRTKKVILDCYSPALLCSVIGSENSNHSLSESRSKLDQLRLTQFRFFAFLGSLLVSTSRSYWPLMMFSIVLSDWFWWVRLWLYYNQYFTSSVSNASVAASTFYTLASLCIFSILFSVHFLSFNKENLWNHHELR